MSLQLRQREIRHAHLFAGLGGGARGFNNGRARVGNTEAVFRCIGGIDVDPGAIADFDQLAGVKGTVLDLFSREQYTRFHGVEPPPGWREAGPEDIHRAFNYEKPHLVLTSPPCKGLSGLLSETTAKTDKYQALNELTLRGIWLLMEAYANDPIEMVMLENVPRIASRGRPLLNQICGVLRHYGYIVSESVHDCGELGNLAQSRKRFLLVARHASLVPAFLYEPVRRSLRGVGEILDKMPLPGDPRAGAMHRVPALQFKTWMRLAFVEAGQDWRSLNRLRVENGQLKDYGLVPDRELRNGSFGVRRWDETSGTVAGETLPTNGNFAVADPRTMNSREGSGYLGVNDWAGPTGTVTGNGRPGAGNFSIADVRVGQNGPRFNNVYRVVAYDEASPAVTGQGGNSAGIVADPRGGANQHVNGKYKICAYEQPTNTIIAGSTTGTGAFAVADPRTGYGPNSHQSKFAMLDWQSPSRTVTGANQVQGGAMSVADPRPACLNKEGRDVFYNGHYGVVPYEGSTGAIPASCKVDNGTWSVADPREGYPDETDCLPQPNDRLIAVIRSLDNTWHRPFTTAELAAIQGLFDPEEAYSPGGVFQLAGKSDAAHRERIGNAIPAPTAAAIASVMGKTLLLAWQGETFALSETPIWVQPLAIALSVHQPNYDAAL